MTQVATDAHLRALERDRIVVPQGMNEAVAGWCFCRLLDRTPSERSEDKLVFLINDQPVDLFARTIERSAAERMGIDDESDQVP